MLHSWEAHVERAHAENPGLALNESLESLEPLEAPHVPRDSTQSAQAIYARLFRELRPRTPLPDIRIEYRRYANANAQVRWHDGELLVRLADTLAGAPDDVVEALARILLSKLFRRPVPAASNDRYRRYLNRRDIRRSLDLVRQIRGRKQVEHPQGQHFDLEQMFEELNFRYFYGLMARPRIGWSPHASRTLLDRKSVV